MRKKPRLLAQSSSARSANEAFFLVISRNHHTNHMPTATKLPPLQITESAPMEKHIFLLHIHCLETPNEYASQHLRISSLSDRPTVSTYLTTTTSIEKKNTLTPTHDHEKAEKGTNDKRRLFNQVYIGVEICLVETSISCTTSDNVFRVTSPILTRGTPRAESLKYCGGILYSDVTEKRDNAAQGGDRTSHSKTGSALSRRLSGYRKYYFGKCPKDTLSPVSISRKRS